MMRKREEELDGTILGNILECSRAGLAPVFYLSIPRYDSVVVGAVKFL